MFSDAHCHFRHLPYDAIELAVKRIEKADIELVLLTSVDVGSSIHLCKKFLPLRDLASSKLVLGYTRGMQTYVTIKLYGDLRSYLRIHRLQL